MACFVMISIREQRTTSSLSVKRANHICVPEQSGGSNLGYTLYHSYANRDWQNRVSVTYTEHAPKKCPPFRASEFSSIGLPRKVRIFSAAKRYEEAINLSELL
ncbi:hypothetical protein AVEN_226827-1 [Araneus ventricosus]|uniref:Uncharacterized protein n=1 Tax=Araneus ventricosus TaxID=182803 RepID=A0A4Y2TIS2_ARAVE|nr:hypothetical protein AVEN_226827-1 [Araneus ventricosus]